MYKNGVNDIACKICRICRLSVLWPSASPRLFPLERLKPLGFFRRYPRARGQGSPINKQTQAPIPCSHSLLSPPPRVRVLRVLHIPHILSSSTPPPSSLLPFQHSQFHSVSLFTLEQSVSLLSPTLKSFRRSCCPLASPVTSRFPPLNTSAKVPRSSYEPSRRSRLRCTSNSSDSSSSSLSPITPADSQTPLSSGASSSSAASASSSSGFRFHDDASDHESNGYNTDPESTPPSPVFTPFPTRQARTSTISKAQSAISLAAPTAMPTVLPRRNPSFPVSRPLRPFDSISNAMSTAAITGPPDLAPSVGSGELEMKTKPKPKRSNVLLEPTKNPRFACGFFTIDMTQEEFKTRA